MGTIILIISAIIEIALGAYCIITKSNQKTIRSWVRISAFIVFVILTLVSVIQWGFGWYLTGFLLLVWTIIACVSLIRNKPPKKEYKAIRIITKGIAMWLLVLIAIVPELIFPQYKQPDMTGNYKVNTATYTYCDNKYIETFTNTGEARKVTVKFWYPANTNGKYPLIVFSHGAIGVIGTNTSTFKDLASNGYIVCSVSHPYHSMFTKDTDGKFTMVNKAFVQEIIDVNNGVYDAEEMYRLEQKWLKVRTQDINLVIDNIKKYSKSSSEKVYQLVDIERIGLIGHSLGGAAVVQLGRERSDVDAVINLDADLLGECLGVENGQPVINRSVYPVPLLSIYSDIMKKLFDEADKQGMVIPQKLITATAPHSYEIYIKGTEHMSLTDLPLLSPFMVKMIDGSIKKAEGIETADKYYVINTMNSLVRDFFNYYLKGKGSFQPNKTY